MSADRLRMANGQCYKIGTLRSLKTGHHMGLEILAKLVIERTCMNHINIVLYTFQTDSNISLAVLSAKATLGVLGTCVHRYVHTSVFLISLYGAPLAQRASYLALRSALFGPVVQLIMITLSLTALTLC